MRAVRTMIETMEKPRYRVRPWAAGALIEVGEDEPAVQLDRDQAIAVAFDLLRATQPEGRWFPPLYPGRPRWRILEDDGLVTIEFEDGFMVDRYACPDGIIFDRSHYRPDGSCRCPDDEK